jgi:hypothetical protein
MSLKRGGQIGGFFFALAVAQVHGATISWTNTTGGSTNLINWADISTNTPLAMPFTFSDTNAGNFKRRFYRALQGP